MKATLKINTSAAKLKVADLRRGEIGIRPSDKGTYLAIDGGCLFFYSTEPPTTPIYISHDSITLYHSQVIIEKLPSGTTITIESN